MKLEVDSESPIPLYHQIAEAVRAAIAAGKLAPGDVLQPMRQAAEEWGVAIQTVRHAYASLAREGLVESGRGRRGTWVVASGPSVWPTGSSIASNAYPVRRRPWWWQRTSQNRSC